MTADVVDAGDGLPLTVPDLLRARVAAATGRRAARLRRRRRSPTARPTGARPSSPGRCSRPVRARARASAILHPNGPEFVVAWLAAARIGAISRAAQHVLHQRRARRPPARRRRRRPPRRRRLPRARLRREPARRDPRARPRRARAAALRHRPVAAAHRVRARRRRRRPVSTPTGRPPGSSTAAARVGDDVLAAAEAAVTPADRMVIVHTSGSTSAPKGVIHVHGALLRHLDNLNELRRYDRGEVLFSNSPFFWIGGFAYALLGTLVAGATARLLERARRRGRARRARARAADDGERVRGVGGAPPAGPDVRARVISRRSGGGTCTRSCRRRCDRGTPSCTTPCSA